MTGIKDVAREVGVSTATVSRALRGLPRVSPETRERVLEVATRMEYVASPHAASLASGQTRAIGVVVPNVTRWFFGSVVHGAEELLRAGGLRPAALHGHRRAGRAQRLFSAHLLSKRVDAVMVLALRPTPEEVASLDRTGSPTVVVGGAVPGWSSVRIDDVEAAATAVRHLVELGHKRIAHLGGVPDPEHAGLDFSTPGDRLRGYRMTMEAAGLRDRTRLGGDRRLHRPRRSHRLPAAARRPATCPTAIFAGSDEMAIGASHAVREAGLRVPDDISVIGIDNHELSEYFDLSTMAQPAPELGRLGARMPPRRPRLRHPAPTRWRRSSRPS